jgi:hypothetical protein
MINSQVATEGERREQMRIDEKDKDKWKFFSQSRRAKKK